MIARVRALAGLDPDEVLFDLGGHASWAHDGSFPVVQYIGNGQGTGDALDFSQWRSRLLPTARRHVSLLTGSGRGQAMAELTQLIEQARKGDADAARALFESVYHDLHRLAARQVQRGSGGLGSTSLVHEAYLRLARPEALSVNDRGHFFAVAARAMRQIAVDHARERLTAKRGGGVADATLGAAERQESEAGQRHDQLLALDSALEALERADPRLARLVELRFFAGLNLEEAGDALGLSPTTLKRDFRRARAFLHARLGESGGGDALD